MIAKIIVDNKSKQVDKPFDYLVPKELEGKIKIGSRVLVPFSSGNREIEGFCVGTADTSDSKRLKSIIRTANDSIGFDEDMLELIEWMHKKYLASYLDIIHTIVPSGTALKTKEWIILENKSEEKSEIRRRITEILTDNGGSMEFKGLKEMCGVDIQNQVRAMIKEGTLKKEYRQSVDIKDKKIKCVKLICDRETALESAEILRRKAPVQAKMLEVLSENDYVSLADLQKFTNGSHSTVKALEKKNPSHFAV